MERQVMEALVDERLRTFDEPRGVVEAPFDEGFVGRPFGFQVDRHVSLRTRIVQAVFVRPDGGHRLIFRLVTVADARRESATLRIMERRISRSRRLLTMQCFTWR